MRIDLPDETQNYHGINRKIPDKTAMLLPWHQDYPYNQGSKKSLTIYVPLQSSNTNNGGTLEVAIKSQKRFVASYFSVEEKIFKIGSNDIKRTSYNIPKGEL